MEWSLSSSVWVVRSLVGGVCGCGPFVVRGVHTGALVVKTGGGPVGGGIHLGTSFSVGCGGATLLFTRL